MSSNSKLNLPPLLIGYISGHGWTLTEISSTGRVDYTPQAFEAEYGYLPNPLSPTASRFLKKKLKEYYAHRKKQNPVDQRQGSGRGFG